MEENHEFRFVCKLCYKKYPNGKSLGVHMKSHVMLASSDEKPAYPNSPNKEKNPGYVLRENPKRSWRTVPPMANDHHHHHEDKLMICRQCGKGFPSLKALCGHMACHSDREREMKENDSSSSNTDHTESDTESDSSRRRQMMRYNKGNIIDNCSSSCSEMIDHEQEELALCLMMLSRESGKWVNLTSSFDSDSDNTKVPTPRGQGIVQSVNSDSGYFMNETEKVESDVSSGGFYKVKVSMEEGPSKKKKKKQKEASLSVYKSRGKKKKKGHVCPICDKVYMSGQALGGHKRSHFLVSSEERNNRGGSLSKIKTTTTRRNFFDLNFPPPAEE